MKVAILGAMDEEITLIRDSLEQCQEQTINHLNVFTGKLGVTDVVLVKCGIGKVAASVSTTVIVNQFKPDFVINTGSAGGFSSHLNIGDIVVATELRHFDADLTHFGYEIGQCAGMPTHFECDKKLIDLTYEHAKSMDNLQVELGLICTGDSFVGSDEAAAKITENFPKACAVEMEGVAIAQSCHLLGVPYLVIRSLSDIAGKTSTVSFQTYLEKAAKNSAELVMKTILNLK
ncbi:5'-methylthioadenosine/S-adenosylhomocysteine nucleosidase [Paraglaciecola sp. 2405UD69-4]|uniref:5'-methylthioadenosine/S-adenosylhomocysteine nucleosidase n=1 Tax=Paraglaciecola sp. 2405UD69-4 TaxID=3391836 RepID=UPI0039C90F9A